ncbi:MAG: FHA domain-containing protein [Myxococcota bacterium]
MGVLWSERKQQGWSLATRNLIGRGPECLIQLDDPRVSANHAILTWKDGWLLRDLNSRNGTQADERSLPKGQPVPIYTGARLRFGETDALVLLAAGPPGPAAICGERAAEAKGGLLLIPNAEQPRAVVYAARDAHWVLELDGHSEAVADGRRLVLDGQLWTVLLPRATASAGVPTTLSTSALGTLEAMGLRFVLSQDEEHVNVTVIQSGSTQALRSRVHHFVLLQLARARLSDRASGTAEAEAGWVYTDDLCRQLGITPSVLNLRLLRARQQLAAAGISDAGRLIVRRRLSGQLRLEVPDLDIQQTG